MTLPITNKAMYACFDAQGNILWHTLDWTKEDSQKKGKGRVCKMVSVDVEVMEI